MSIHLGINFNITINKINKLIKNKIIIYIIYILIILLGIYSFIKVEFWYHLIGKYDFGLVTSNFITNTLEYLSIIITITIITNFTYRKGKIK